MVEYHVKSDKGEAQRPPDIFKAATNDDVAELARAMQDGQKLDELRMGYITTPVHLACAHQSLNFLKVAIEHGFNPWVRDQNDRLPIDHAIARELPEVPKQLFEMMYFGDWQIENVATFPEPEPGK